MGRLTWQELMIHQRACILDTARIAHGPLSMIPAREEGSSTRREGAEVFQPYAAYCTSQYVLLGRNKFNVKSTSGSIGVLIDFRRGCSTIEVSSKLDALLGIPNSCVADRLDEACAFTPHDGILIPRSRRPSSKYAEVRCVVLLL